MVFCAATALAGPVADRFGCSSPCTASRVRPQPSMVSAGCGCARSENKPCPQALRHKKIPVARCAEEGEGGAFQSGRPFSRVTESVLGRCFSSDSTLCWRPSQVWGESPSMYVLLHVPLFQPACVMEETSELMNALKVYDGIHLIYVACMGGYPRHECGGADGWLARLFAGRIRTSAGLQPFGCMSVMSGTSAGKRAGIGRHPARGPVS